MSFKQTISRISILSLICVSVTAPSARSEEVTAAVHVHSTASKGHRDIFQLAQLAKKQGVDAVILTDSVIERYEYGIPPLRQFIRKVVERESISKYGAESYFKELGEASRRYPDILLIAGASLTPYYYWSGSLMKGNLTLRQRAKDMLIFGLDSADALADLPIMGLKNAPYSMYEKNQGYSPYQKVIDHVKDEGGFTFWSHPSAEEHLKTHIFARQFVTLQTSSYEEDILKVRDHAGFGINPAELAVLENSRNALVSPGGLWDRWLTGYVRGKRQQPLWVLGELDYTGDSKTSSNLGTMLNVFLAKKKTKTEVLSAFRQGRYYIVMPSRLQAPRLILEDFSIHDSVTAHQGHLSETVSLFGKPEVHLSLRYVDGREGNVRLQLIRNGKIYKEWEETVPFQTVIHGPNPASHAGPSYYRLVVFSEEGDRIMTNPIFTRPAQKTP